MLANATVDEYGRYRVNCGKAAVLPDITFHIGEQDLSVPARDYVYKDWTVKDQKLCLLGIAMNGNDASDDSWTLGAILMSSHCVAYEWDKKMIGFATSKVTK
ncbi:renin-like protein [Aphelenchoides avenae]|nr:renin-like protein [Aphelenchus avenae]